MADSTLKYMRSDTARSPFAKARRRDDPRLGARMVALDGDPDPTRVRTVLVGVADDRGVGLAGGRLGAIEGPQRFRDYFWRMHAPETVGNGSILDAGDMVSAARTNETHARLTEVIDVLQERFKDARMVVVGGGHDHVYGEVLGLARWLKRSDRPGEVKLAHVCINARANVHATTGEPNASGGIRRMLLEPSTRLDGKSLVMWGLQRAENADMHLDFLRSQGAAITLWADVERDRKGATDRLVRKLRQLAKSHDGVTMSIDLCAFAQPVAPGVSGPSVVGVEVGAVLTIVSALASLPGNTQLGIYGLNPRHDRDGATARLAARLAWNYVTTLAG